MEYLTRVTEVKDTVNKHTLLHHLANIVTEKFPDSSDLYSEIGAVSRCAKVFTIESRASVAVVFVYSKRSAMLSFVWGAVQVLAQ